MKKIGNKLFYVIKVNNWKKIEKVFNLPKDFLLKEKMISKKFFNNDKELYLTDPQLTKLANKLNLTLYSLLYELKGKIQEDILPRATTLYYEDQIQNVRSHIAHAHILRENFLLARKRLHLSETDNIVTPDLTSNQKIRDYLALDSEEYINAKTYGGSKNSKISYLKKKIENLGCLVFETGDKNPINSDVILGLFSWYKHWPIIILNSQIKNGPRKIFTLMHELFHFLDSKKNKINIASGEEEEYEANKFAARILFPRDYLSKVTPDSLDEWVKNNVIITGASQLCQMIRLKETGFISHKVYNEWREQYDKRPITKSKGGFYYAPTSCSRILGINYIKLFEETYVAGIYSRANVCGKLGIRQSYMEQVFEYWS